jgi:hypothetical protein
MRNTGLQPIFPLWGAAHSGVGRADDRIRHAGKADLC